MHTYVHCRPILKDGLIHVTLKSFIDVAQQKLTVAAALVSEWPSGLYSLRQVAEVKLGRVRSNSGWVTLEA